jgi:ABC-type transport system involved in cytochrome bd biosynthesis fused ATPase/permease subunit
LKNAIKYLSIIVFLIGFTTISYGQKNDRKISKAKKSLKEARNDEINADEALMVAQVDSVVQSEKLKKEMADKIAAQKKKSQNTKQIPEKKK